VKVQALVGVRGVVEQGEGVAELGLQIVQGVLHAGQGQAPAAGVGYLAAVVQGVAVDLEGGFIYYSFTNLLAKYDCRLALRDEVVPMRPEVPLISSPCSSACRAERLART
jgi:hypothetical protein